MNLATTEQGSLHLTSLAFAPNTPIPTNYTCKGQNISPPLTIVGPPEGTQSLALIMHDPDAPNGDWVHWLLWNISPTTIDVAENTVPVGSAEGTTSFGKPGYGGPCPPSGTHHYVFDLYALNATIDLPTSTTRDQLEAAIKDKTLAHTQLVGLFSN